MGSLSLPLAVVVVSESVAKTGVAKTVMCQSTIHKVGVSLSLRGSLSLPLAVVVVSESVAKTGVAKTVMCQSTIHKVGGSLSLPLAVVVASVAKTVAVAKTIAVANTIAVVGISLCLGFRLSGSDGRKSENYEQFHVECRMSRSQLCSPC